MSPGTEPLTTRIAAALEATGKQLLLCPDAPELARVADLARVLVGQRDIALTSPAPLLPLFERVLASAPDDEIRQALCVARAGLVSQGLALAHTHVRLNAAQIHNAVRQRPGIADAPEDPAHRRALFGAMNAALDTVQPISVGALLAEQASAIRLMMTIAQIIKHVDGSVPVRFLIAETETDYTLLAALWLARLFNIERRIEISPLFETARALEYGATVREAALRSPHYRAYLKMQQNMLHPLGMNDTGFKIGTAQRQRLAKVHDRTADGFVPTDLELPQEPEFEMGGGGLYSTVSDYLCFTRMIMNNGALDGTRVLAPQTVTIMGANAMGDLTCRALKTSAPAPSNDVDFIDGMPWGLSFLINPQPLPTGRAAGSLAWAGLANTYRPGEAGDRRRCHAGAAVLRREGSPTVPRLRDSGVSAALKRSPSPFRQQAPAAPRPTRPGRPRLSWPATGPSAWSSRSARARPGQSPNKGS